MVKDFEVISHVFSGIPTGTYKKNRLGNDVAIYKYDIMFETALGKMTQDEWRERILSEVKKEHMEEHLRIIMDHCRTYVWLHGEQKILDYSLEILANEVYKCGNELWQDVIEKINALPQNK